MEARSTTRDASLYYKSREKKGEPSRGNRDFAIATNAALSSHSMAALGCRTTGATLRRKNKKSENGGRAHHPSPPPQSPNAARPSVWPPAVPQKRRSILIALARPIFRHRRFDVTYASYGITRELTAKQGTGQVVGGLRTFSLSL